MKITPLDQWIAGKLGVSHIDVSRLQDYQLEKFRETMRHVIKHSNFYQEHLKGINPDEIKTLDDVKRLPFTYPSMLSDCPEDFLCVSPKEISRIVTLKTSGTTGRPKRVFFTPEDQELTIDFFHHGMTTMADSSDRVMIFMPGETEGSIGDLLVKGLSRFDCTGIVYGPIKDYDDAFRALIEQKITCIVGIPSQILSLSRLQSQSTGSKDTNIRTVLLSTDYVPQAVTDSLKKVWNCNVYGHYGMTEMGLGGGVECAAFEGYHMREADLLFEIVDPLTGESLEDGNIGEVVFTTLTRRGMPLIRYRTGDLSRFLVQSCPCASMLRRMDRISGRISGIVKLSKGATLSISQLDETILNHPAVATYKAEINQAEGFDCLEITVKPVGQSLKLEELKGRILKIPSLVELSETGMLRVEVQIGDVDYFTTGTAKRYIFDNRQ